FFSSRRRHTRFSRDWSSDVCSSDLYGEVGEPIEPPETARAASFSESLSRILLKISAAFSSFSLALAFWSSISLEFCWVIVLMLRSEERRVGKECSVGWRY